MAGIEVRTPEDLDKVFTDLFALLYQIHHQVGVLQGQVHNLEKGAVIKTMPVFTPPPPSWVTKVTSIDDDTDMTKEIQGVIKAFKNDKKARE